MTTSDSAPDTAPDRGPTPPGTAEHPSRGRGVAAVVCLVLAAVLLVPAGVAYWGQRTLNDTQRYVATVGPLVNSPEVQDAIANVVSDAIEAQVDIEAVIQDVFQGVIKDPDRLERLAGPLAGAVYGLIDREVRAFIASDTFEELWVQVNTRAQQALQRILTGEQGGAVQLVDDQVVLDVSSVIEQVQQRLVDRGLTLLANVSIPTSDRQIVLLDAPQVSQLRTVYAFANPVAQWALLVVGLLFLAAFVLARRPARMVVAIGAVIAVDSLLLAWALSVGSQVFVNHLSGTVFGPASRVFYTTLLAFLERGQDVLLWLGLILVVAGWYAGSNQYGAGLRSGVARGLEQVGGSLGDTQLHGPGAWVATNLRWLRPVVWVLGAVVLLWGNDVSPQRLFWSVVLVVVLLVVLQVLAGAGRTREPAAAEVPAPG